MICARCENTSAFYMQQKGAQTGLYCKQCLRWQKWVGKKDIDSYRRRGIVMVSPTANVEAIGVEVNSNTLEVGIEVNTEQIEGSVKTQEVERPMEIKTEEDIKNQIVKDLKRQEMEIEARVQARVEIELENMRKEIKQEGKKEEEEESEGCSFCRGEVALEGEETRVDIGLYGGLLVVTTKNGETVQGFFPAKYCNNCGKKQ